MSSITVMAEKKGAAATAAPETQGGSRIGFENVSVAYGSLVVLDS